LQNFQTLLLLELSLLMGWVAHPSPAGAAGGGGGAADLLPSCHGNDDGDDCFPRGKPQRNNVSSGETKVLSEGVDSSPGVSALCSLHQCPHFSFHSVAGISCSWSWTRSFVLLWLGTLSKFEMLIWHPTGEKALDELLDAEVNV
jgi:hypothetical protein